MREHEFPAADGGGRRFCKWCGALSHAQLAATCIDRPDPGAGLAPEPKRRQLACEDADAIAARLAELRREREAALSPAAEPPAAVAVAAETDFICG